MATEAIATDISTASVTHHLVPATISQRSVISLMARWGLTLDSRDLEAGIVTLARAHGVTIGRAVETVDTVDVPSDVAGVLRIDPDEAVLRVERIVRSTEGIPIEWCVGFVVLWKHEHLTEFG